MRTSSACPIAASLGVIVLLIGGSIVLSLLRPVDTDAVDPTDPASGQPGPTSTKTD